MSYSSAAATPGAAETTRPRPATGTIARSTSAISFLVAPAASARAALHCRQTADDPMATDTATCSNAAVLASSVGVSASPRPNPASTNPSSKSASLRRVSWYLAAWLILLRCRRHKYTSSGGGSHHPAGVKTAPSSLQEPQFAALPPIVGCAAPPGRAFVVVRVRCPLVAGQSGPAGDPAEVLMAVHAAKHIVSS